MSSETRRDHPSDVLKAMTRTGFLYCCPSNKSVITVSMSVSRRLLPAKSAPDDQNHRAPDGYPDCYRGMMDGD